MSFNFSFKIQKVSVAMIALSLSVFALPVKLKHLSFSASSTWDRWESKNLGWDQAMENPKTEKTIRMGSQVLLSDKMYMGLSLHGFYNQIESFKSAENIVVHSESGFRILGIDTIMRPTLTAMGLGDIKVSLSTKRTPLKHSLKVTIPTGYRTKEKIFYNPPGYLPQTGFAFGSPWTGLGVYQGGYSLSHVYDSHYIMFAYSTVVFKPSGKNAGLVEVGDFSLYSLYAKGIVISDKMKTIPSVEMGYSQYHWEGKGKRSRQEFSLQPGLSFAFSPTWSKEFKLSMALTGYSISIHQGKKVASPRKISIGLSYALYR